MGDQIQNFLTIGRSSAKRVKLEGGLMTVPSPGSIVDLRGVCPCKAAFTAAEKSAPSQALISYTPLEQFWLKCIINALKANSTETWVVMPQNQGGRIFQMSLQPGSNRQGSLTVDVEEVDLSMFSEQQQQNDTTS